MSNAIYTFYDFLNTKKLTVHLTNKIRPKNMKENIKNKWIKQQLYSTCDLSQLLFRHLLDTPLKAVGSSFCSV